MRITLFDFDGTVVAGDTFLAFLLSLMRRHPNRLPAVLGAAVLSMPLLRRDETTSRALARIVAASTAGHASDELERQMDIFVEERIKRPWLYPEARDRVRRHLDSGDRVVVVTGCEERLARRVCSALQLPSVEVVGSRLRKTARGHELALHCFHEHKLRALGAAQLPPPYAHLYTDSTRDLPLVRAAERTTLVNPNTATERAFRSSSSTPLEIVRWRAAGV
jgi:phosphatidylglycerophosphatase C